MTTSLADHPRLPATRCTAYVRSDALDDELEELREVVESTSPLIDSIANEVPLETAIVSRDEVAP